MRKILPITLLLLVFFSVKAQKQLQGKMSGNILLNPQKNDYLYHTIYLYGINANSQWEQIDSAKIDGQGRFTLYKNDPLPVAYYRICFSQEGWKYGIYNDIVLKQDTSILYLNFDATQLRVENKIASNPENEALYLFKAFIEKWEKVRANYKYSVSAEQLNYTAFNYITQFQKAEQDYLKELDSLQKELAIFRKQHQGSYTADVIASLFSLPLHTTTIKNYDNSRAFLKDSWIKHWNFENETLIYNPFFQRKIYEYLSEYTYIHSFEGIQFSVDNLLQKAKANPKVFDFVLNYLIKTYLQGGFEKMVNYIYDTYYDACSQPITSASEELKKFERLQQLKEGKKAPNILLSNTDNKKIELETVAKKNDIIILYFWSSTCAHCQKGTEMLKNLYKKYQKQGLEVYAVSLDEEENDWKNYIKKQNTTWHNVWAKEGWKSKTATDYVISRTPTIYIINSNLKIVANGLYYSELANWLENYFNTAQLKK